MEPAPLAPDGHATGSPAGITVGVHAPRGTPACVRARMRDVSLLGIRNANMELAAGPVWELVENSGHRIPWELFGDDSLAWSVQMQRAAPSNGVETIQHTVPPTHDSVHRQFSIRHGGGG